MWAAIFAIIQKLLGIIPDAPTAEATAESTGEDAGKAKVQAANSTAAVGELEHAQQGAADASAARNADGGKLLTDGPDVRPYSPTKYD